MVSYTSPNAKLRANNHNRTVHVKRHLTILMSNPNIQFLCPYEQNWMFISMQKPES